VFGCLQWGHAKRLYKLIYTDLGMIGVPAVEERDGVAAQGTQACVA